MAKQLDKDMLRMMSITERFNYIAAKKQMQATIDKSNKSENLTCNYSGLPSTESYSWVDRDDDSGYDSSSDGRKKRGDESYDDSNEY
jgi:hypothetical protein|tara:strand:- start:210 stop:470 length:261 start_codon:yes stop_codon:yes gene_type:complete